MTSLRSRVKLGLMKKRIPFIASILSFFCPGLGQIYNSQIKFGFIVFATAYFIISLSVINNYFIFIFFIFGWIIIWIFSIIYAFIKAIKIKKAQLTKFNKWILYLFFILVGYLYVSMIVLPNIKFQNFNIPATSMNPTLIVGDYIVVNKNYYKNNDPEYGDLVVFKTPTDNRTDYIKRLIGLPDDTIQFINGDVYLNDNQILKTKIKSYKKIYCGNAILETKTFEEKLPNGKKYIAIYSKNNSFQNSDKFKVPKDHYFFLGDNRDCSKDSRFLSAVGYVPRKNILHKLYMIYWSGDKSRIGLFPK